MHKILVFDLDGTLAPVGGGMTGENMARLVRLERLGYRIALCSGKPVTYLCGFARNLGLREPILMGENGASTQFGIDLPPRRHWRHPHTREAAEQLATIRRLIEEAVPEGSWYQANDVCLTPFPKNADVFDAIQQVLDAHPEALGDLTVYRHIDSFDIVPSNISKKSGLAILSEREGLCAADYIAIGDGVNDVPMFEYADLSILVGGRLDYPATYCFAEIDEALSFMLEVCP